MEDFWQEDIFKSDELIEITEEVIDVAFSRVESFALMNKGRSLENKKEAIATMIGALGLDRDKLNAATIRIKKITASGETGAVLLGILIGLYISDERLKLNENNKLSF